MRSSVSVIAFDQQHELIERMIANVEKVIVGKRETIHTAMVALLCGGHVLLEDVPGVGKTMLARALAKTVSCSLSRIQFTPDLLPSDIMGVSIYNQKLQQFEFRPGPIMANFVLADRDEPNVSTYPSCASGSDGRAQCDGGRRDACFADAVHFAGNAKSDRA